MGLRCFSSVLNKIDTFSTASPQQTRFAIFHPESSGATLKLVSSYRGAVKSRLMKRVTQFCIKVKVIVVEVASTIVFLAYIYRIFAHEITALFR